MSNAQLALLKPHGNLDMEYLSKTIFDQNATYLGVVPTILIMLCEYLKSSDEYRHRIETIRRFSSGGTNKIVREFL
jgi:hypothetical protein